MLEHSNHPSKPSRSWGSNGDSFLHVSSVSQECTRMPDCTDRYIFPLFSQQICRGIDACQTGYCTLNITSIFRLTPVTPQKRRCFILLPRQKITETSISHTLHNLGLLWTWNKDCEEEKDAITVTTGAHLGCSLWPIYLQVATRITTPRGWWFVGIEEKVGF